MRKLLTFLLLGLAATAAQAQVQPAQSAVFWKAKQAVVSLTTPGQQYSDCAGTVVAPHVIITSQHCFDGAIPLINGQATTVTKIADDGDARGEAVLLSVPDIAFKHIAPIAKKLRADYGEDVFMWGQPIGFDWTLRKGYRAGMWDKQVFNDNVKPQHAYHSYVMEAINGDSGSPIFNMKGELIGLVTAKRTWAEYWPNGDLAKTYSLTFSAPIMFTKKQWRAAGVER